ncbi:phosphatase PAP2 family protein [Nonomuraea zeae]|uniref:phosphatase PAP2 family protein n=1 Tax=Nonomuraea zeae TaxID=1642303 RepID=UPI0014784ECC|nr:phosphatase PAP2 family protein [Nonomuraea zeae]
MTDCPALLAGYAAAASFVLAARWAERRFPGNRPAALARFAAPLLVLPFVYSAAADTVLVLHGRYLDDTVSAWETSLFGGLPNVLTGAVGFPPLTELLTLCYFSFYGCFLIPVLLYTRGRRALGERYLFAAMLTLLTCYLGFMAVPLAGPAAAAPELYAAYRPSGYVITTLQGRIMAAFDPPGTCFPSPHVAGAWITLLCLRRHVTRNQRVALWALTSGLTAAVVYDWYHYVSDVAAGLAVALAAHAVAKRLSVRRERPRIPVPA